MRRLHSSSGGRSGGLRWRRRVSGNASARVTAALPSSGLCSARCRSGARKLSISCSEYPCTHAFYQSPPDCAHAILHYARHP